MTLAFFVAAMKLSTALERYLPDLQETAAAISHDLSNGVMQ
jgi:IclR family mhp operon transcriptional activator